MHQIGASHWCILISYNNKLPQLLSCPSLMTYHCHVHIVEAEIDMDQFMGWCVHLEQIEERREVKRLMNQMVVGCMGSH